MKQRLVIKVSMNNHVSSFCCFSPPNPHSKALKLAGGFRGVQSVALVGDSDQIEVTGEVDAVNLTTLLRKKVGFAEIVSVSSEGASSESPPSETAQPIVASPYPRQEIVYFRDQYPEPWCWPL